MSTGEAKLFYLSGAARAAGGGRYERGGKRRLAGTANLEGEWNGLQKTIGVAVDGEVAEVKATRGQVSQRDDRSRRAVHAHELRDPLALFDRDRMAEHHEIEIAGKEIFYGIRCGEGWCHAVAGFFEHAVAREEKWA